MRASFILSKVLQLFLFFFLDKVLGSVHFVCIAVKTVQKKTWLVVLQHIIQTQQQMYLQYLMFNGTNDLNVKKRREKVWNLRSCVPASLPPAAHSLKWLDGSLFFFPFPLFPLPTLEENLPAATPPGVLQQLCSLMFHISDSPEVADSLHHRRVRKCKPLRWVKRHTNQQGWREKYYYLFSLNKILLQSRWQKTILRWKSQNKDLQTNTL